MKITVQVSGVEQVISISQIRTLQVIDENTTRLSFYNGRKNVKNAILNKNLETFASEIQKLAGDKEAYGTPIFRDPFKDFSYHHRISLLREMDSTTHKRLCPLCGRIDQIYHTGCSCKVEIPFSGKKSVTKKDGLKLTRQVVELDLRDDDPTTIQHVFNAKGEFLKEKPVTNIHWDEYSQRICGHIKVCGSWGVLVYTDEVESIEDIETKRYNWWRYEEQSNKAA